MERASFCKIIDRLELMQLERKPLTETKKAIVIFHYTEKIKSSLILAFRLLEVLNGLRDEEVMGAEKLLASFVDALFQEVNTAANATQVKGFKQVGAKLDEVNEQVKKHSYAMAMKLVSEAISIATTSGAQAAEMLKERDLI
jgi:hypothetical protein